jgi:hypothetical protein
MQLFKAVVSIDHHGAVFIRKNIITIIDNALLSKGLSEMVNICRHVLCVHPQTTDYRISSLSLSIYSHKTVFIFLDKIDLTNSTGGHHDRKNRQKPQNTRNLF